MTMIASAYASIPDRTTSFSNVRRELARIINAPPTSIHPYDRTAFLDTILADLAPGSTWTSWPEDVHTLALTAVKSLGRNPVGSETLLSDTHLATLIHHTTLPLDIKLTPNPSIPLPPSSSALEALRALANTLVLHPVGRRKAARLGVGEAVAHVLAEDVAPDHLFLLGRLGFLVTVDGDGSVVRDMVDRKAVVSSIVYYLYTLKPVPVNYDALSELLKLSGNIIRSYPSQQDEKAWDNRLTAFLYPLLCIVHYLPFNDLIPPLSHALHALLSIPFTPDLIATWHSVPGVKASSRRSPSPSSSVRTLLGKLGVSSSAQPRRGSSESTSSLSPPSHDDGTVPVSSSSPRHVSMPERIDDPSDFPQRLICILTEFIDSRLAGVNEPAPELLLDDVLPPALLLAARAAEGSPDMRAVFRQALFPSDLDRSRETGGLETRPGLLGTLLRLMNGSNHVHSRDTAGEFLWAVCGGDAAEICTEIGYGNAAGLLFRKGISGPPPAKIQELDEPSTASTAAETAGPDATRHPITGLRADKDDGKPALDDMTNEEKEREAERLFVLFDRLERNPILGLGTQSPSGEKQSVQSLIADKLAAGEGEQWDLAEAKREVARAQEEEEEDEAEALREIEAYRRRTGRG